LWSGAVMDVGTLTFYNAVLGIAIGEAVIILALLFVLAHLRTKQQRKQ
jgi:hypothetical protein